MALTAPRSSGVAGLISIVVPSASSAHTLAGPVTAGIVLTPVSFPAVLSFQPCHVGRKL
jgi:hypothetical protein